MYMNSSVAKRGLRVQPTSIASVYLQYIQCIYVYNFFFVYIYHIEPDPWMD